MQSNMPKKGIDIYVQQVDDVLVVSSEMLAAVVPSVNANWEVKEVPKPQPATDQVLIKIHASGICYTDAHITKCGLGVKFPSTIGHEPAGEIVALGEGVTTRKVGDRVGVPWA
jgi:alcohol dehydrogenase